MIKQVIKSISGAAATSGPGTGDKARENGTDGSLQRAAEMKIPMIHDTPMALHSELSLWSYYAFKQSRL